MTSRRSFPLAASAALAAALAVAAPLGAVPQRARAAAPPPGSLLVQSSLAPNPAFFGDPVVALVTVDLDTTRIDPGSVKVEPSFAPYAVTGTPRVTTMRAGSEETQVYRYALQCASDGCLPPGAPRRIQLPPVIVTASAAGAPVGLSAPWAPAFVVSRLSSADVAGFRPHFHWPTTLPPASYDVQPGLLADLLTALAAILLAAGFGLVALELAEFRARARRRAARVLSPLEAALAYTREAAGRDARDRRKALALLSSTLESTGHQTLADSAGAVAWSEQEPSAAHASGLADEIESELGPGRA